MDEWEIRVTNEIRQWIYALDEPSRIQVVDAIDRLAEAGPGLGRPLVDKLEASRIHNLKELRPGSAGRSEIRILFVFDPWRSAILLIGGDKSGDWSGWYRRAIPRAEELRST
ncbi:type II toxin-antitoxin system RelE/ParE family toxin [Nonomuraea sp. NPDC059194]|uniref:type II toxin-antitoxin system RelE/ParE family toxin n=1 Tax=Nonomuraea sp. NPDC059194 TaxID=3346764 RepID=UPI003693D55B